MSESTNLFCRLCMESHKFIMELCIESHYFHIGRSAILVQKAVVIRWGCHVQHVGAIYEFMMCDLARRAIIRSSAQPTGLRFAVRTCLTLHALLRNNIPTNKNYCLAMAIVRSWCFVRLCRSCGVRLWLSSPVCRAKRCPASNG